MGRKQIKFIKLMLFFAIIAAGSGFFLYLFFAKNQRKPYGLGAYFFPVKICEFSDANTPCINIEVEDKPAIVELDLGCCDTSLNGQILKNIRKGFVGKHTFSGLRGRRYESDIYKIPKILIGELTFSHLKISETNLEFEKDGQIRINEKNPTNSYLGRIGWEIFYIVNLLLDCERSTLAFCDSLSTLKQNGYPVEEFTRIPICLDRGIIEFDAMTEKGILRCMLDTGSTWSFLNKDLEKNSIDHMIYNPMNIDPKHFQLSNPDNVDVMVIDLKKEYKVSSLKIGEKDFGPFWFTPIKTPVKIDAIIGMDFIDSTVIFIDFQNREMFFYEYPEAVGDLLPIN